MEYRWYGRTERHPQYGESFAAKTFTIAKPHTRSGVVKYLMRYALEHVSGAGQATAISLWNKFKGDAVRLLRESPDVAAAALNNRFDLQKAEAAAKALQSRAALEDCEIALVGLLDGRGFPHAIATQCIAAWGNKAAEMIERNPYLLLLFPRCGFGLTDAMYLDTGLNPNRIKRQALCATYELSSDTDGHTWHPKERLIQAVQGKVSSATANPIKAAKLAVRAGLLVSRRDAEGQLWFSETAKAASEWMVAERVRAMTQEKSSWGDVLRGCESAVFDRLSNHQREVLQQAVTPESTIGVLTGGPGTGKTWVASVVAEATIDTYGPDKIALACPTGKAAVRLTEAMQEHRVSLQATTIHRLLGVEKVNGNGGGWSFVHNESDPLPHKFIVIDEVSMVGASLMASLLRACLRGTHVLFLGDSGQLSPVEHGAPLRDFIDAGVPCGRLTEIQRNAGTIVRACHAIAAGQSPRPDHRLDLDAKPPANLKLLPAANGVAAVDQIVSTIRKIRTAGLCDPIWDVQVVAAVNRKSPLSIRELNTRLQLELNPGGGVQGSPFHVADKVICTKNTQWPAALPASSGEKFLVCNGEQGRVTRVEPRKTFVEFDNPTRLVLVPRGQVTAPKDGNGKGDGNDRDTGNGCDLALAYACTVHKSQGSEWPVVIVALDEHPGARMVCSREWIYTAISRAKMVCFLVGQQATADSMVRRQKLRHRKTFLAELIQQRDY
jgi:exodeoxyribonuclease V alpha subunit